MSWAEVGREVGVAGEGGDVHAFGFGGSVLGVEGLRNGYGEEAKADTDC